MSYVYKIYRNELSKKGKRLFWIVESEYETIGQLHAALCRTLVLVKGLVTALEEVEPTGVCVYRIVDRYDLTLRISHIDSIVVPDRQRYVQDGPEDYPEPPSGT